MHNRLNNLKKAAGHIRLSHDEKSAMRSAIFGAPSPIRPVKSPYVFLSFTSVWGRALAAVMLFVLVGGGTASAAQGALPGDLLYPVKISVTEKLEEALAPSIAAKAEVQAKFAGRRVEEAHSLAAQGRLDAKRAQLLAVQFEAHAQSAETLADEAEVTEPGTAVEIKTSLASSLQTRGKILAKIGGESKDKPTKNESGALAARIIARAEGPARIEAAASTFAAMAPKQGGSEDARVSLAIAEDNAEQHLAAKLQMRASIELADAKRLFGETREHLDATSTVQVEEQFAAAAESMSKGSMLLGGGAYAEAIAHFKNVLTVSAELSALLSAEEKFDNGIIRTLLKEVSDEAEVKVENSDTLKIEL